LFNDNGEEVKSNLESPAGLKCFSCFFDLKTNILERKNKSIKRIMKTPVKMAAVYILLIKILMDSSGIIY
jgi:hypothetical protein